MTPAELRRLHVQLRMDIDAIKAMVDDAAKKMLLIGSALAALSDDEIDTRLAAAKFQCPTCSYGFKTERALAEHERNLEHGRGADRDWMPPHWVEEDETVAERAARLDAGRARAPAPADIAEQERGRIAVPEKLEIDPAIAGLLQTDDWPEEPTP